MLPLALLRATIQALTYLKREYIDVLAELNAIILDADLVKTENLANALNSLGLKKRTVQFILQITIGMMVITIIMIVTFMFFVERSTL